MKRINVVCSQSYNDFQVSAGLMLVVLFSFATVTAQATTPFDRVEEGMCTNQVNELLGTPSYEHKGSSKYAFAWVYCRIPYEVPQSEPDEHPHFWVEFSKDDKTVQKSTAFSEKVRVDPRLQVEDEIK